jgi:hypothetical protein
MGRSLAAWSVAVLLAAGGRLAAVEAGGASSGPRVAATANGQTIAAIDETRRAIVAFDASRPDARRVLVGPAAADAAQFLVVGYLTGDVVAAVCRAGDDWSLCTYRTAPDGPVDAASPLQRIPIGTGSGGFEQVDLAVSHARGWLAVTGLPRPLPPVLRAAVAGVRVGPLSDRGCPGLADDVIAVAAAVSPADELVLALRPSSAEETPPAGGDAIGFFDLAGRALLRLPAGVRGIRGLEFGRGASTLWVTAADSAGATGLWRLDAACVTGRQVIRPTLVAPLDAAGDLVASSPRAIVVVQGGSPERMRVIDPTTLSDPASPGADPGDDR